MATTVRQDFESWGLEINQELLSSIKHPGLPLTLEEFIDLPPMKRTGDDDFYGAGPVKDFIEIDNISFIIRRTMDHPDRMGAYGHDCWHDTYDKYFLPHSSGLTFKQLTEQKVREAYRADLPFYELLIEDMAKLPANIPAPEGGEVEGFVYSLGPRHIAKNPKVSFPMAMFEEVYGHIGGGLLRIPARLMRKGADIIEMDSKTKKPGLFWQIAFNNDIDLMKETSFLGYTAFDIVAPALESDTPAMWEIMRTLCENMTLPEAAIAARLM